MDTKPLQSNSKGASKVKKAKQPNITRKTKKNAMQRQSQLAPV
jgi:hypothetical protein